MAPVIPDARTASQKAADDVAALIRARCSLIWIAAPEETRIEAQIARALQPLSYLTRTWDAFSGVCEINGSAVYEDQTVPDQAIRLLANSTSRECWIFRDLPREMANPSVIRAVRSCARIAATAPRDSARAIVILSPSREIPPELASIAVLIEWPSPDRAEIRSILTDKILGPRKGADRAKACRPEDTDRVVDAAIGLSGEGVEAALAHALIRDGTIGPVAVAQEKKRLIRGKGLEWYDPIPEGLDAIGGLEALKRWAMLRAAALTPEARAYGLPAPRGVLLVGPPGTGKSLACKAVSTAWGVPLLKLDLGATKSKWVGESEANIRAALKVAETIAPCIVWVDEIEKALAGGVNGGGDSGISADILGTLLTWMQESRAGCFVMATANNVAALPPELLRKGRFDDLFFVDLPHRSERVAILSAALRQYGRSIEGIDPDEVAESTEGYTGAEIAALVPEGLYAAFADGARPLATHDLVTAARATVPLSSTSREQINALRTWAKGRARLASIPDSSEAQARTNAREID